MSGLERVYCIVTVKVVSRTLFQELDQIQIGTVTVDVVSRTRPNIIQVQ